MSETIANIVVLDFYTTTTLGADEPGTNSQPSWQPVRELGNLTVHSRTPEEQIINRAKEAQIVLTNKTVINADKINALKNLKYIGMLSTGTNAVDLEAAAQRNITATNVPGYSSYSVAQHVIALLLAQVNQIEAHDRAVHQGKWSTSEDFSFTAAPLTELKGKTLGIVGVGDIGKKVAQIAGSLGMKIAAAHQSSMNRVSLPGIEIDWQPLEKLLPQADVLTLHCPLNDKTFHLLNEKNIASLKPDAIVINTGRGQLIDDNALADALNNEKIGAALLDVLSQEPPDADNPLLHAKNCIITPHIAWATYQARKRLIDAVAENIQKFLDGAPINVVN